MSIPRVRATGMRFWAAVIVLCAVATTACYYFVDIPVARFIHTLPFEAWLRSRTWNIPFLAMIAAIAVIAFGVRALGKSRLDTTSETIVLAALSLALAMCINEFALKPIFGRPLPGYFLRTGHFHFRWLRNDNTSSFPSGHAAQLMAVATVFWSRLKAFRPAYVLVISVALGLLILGNWHFIGDLIAGCFVGAFCAAILLAFWSGRSEAPP